MAVREGLSDQAALVHHQAATAEPGATAATEDPVGPEALAAALRVDRVMRCTALKQS